MALGAFADYFITLYVSFLHCKMGIIIVPIYMAVGGLNEIMHVKTEPSPI